MRPSTKQVVGLLIAWRVPLLVLAVLAAAATFFPARRLQFDRSIENMFAPHDPLVRPFRKLKRVFRGDEIVLAVYVDHELLAPDGRGIRRLAGISRRLAKVPGVGDVVSLDQPLGGAIVDERLAVARSVRRLFEGYTHSGDGTIAAVVCMLSPESEAGVPRRAVIEQLREVVEALPEPARDGMIAGEPVMVVEGYRHVEADGARLALASTLLVAATMLLFFRSIRWVVVPLAVVQLARLLTQAVLAWCGFRLSLVSSLLTAVVTVVGIATVVHVIVRFREARLGGLSPGEALSLAGARLGAPIFWACSTTAVGFASLTVAQVGPVRDFGLMMALASLMVLVSLVLLLPGLALLGHWDTDPKRAWGERFLDRALERLLKCVQRRPKTVGLATLLVAASASAGIWRLEVESNFINNFRSKSRIYRSYRFVETNLGGAGVWDVIVPAPERLDWEYLSRVRRLEDRLREEVVAGADGEPALTKVLSLADGVAALSPLDLDQLPPGPARGLTVSGALELIALKMPALYRALYGEDPEQPGRHYLRIMLRAGEQQPAWQKQEIIARVKRIVGQQFPPTVEAPGAEVTGFFVLLTGLITSVLRDQWLTFGVAVVGIGLMMTVALRSPLLALAALLPNVLAIALVTGLIGWLGMRINLGAAMIAAVSMGLSIDSSIHYITAYRHARDQGASVDAALGSVQRSVGRAMSFSVLALIVGFAALGASQFVPTVYFGVLVSLSMLAALAGNLTVLPLLLRWASRFHFS